MSISINQDLLADGGEDEKDSPLPDGVYTEVEWLEWKEAKKLPAGRTELFTANGRVYTAPSVVDPSTVFRYMRSVRHRDPGEEAMADLLYDTLGEAVMDALATEKLTPEEFRLVMKVVQKHVAGATKQTLGN